MDTKPVQRRFDLDWLRVLVILAVFIYHSTRFFNLGDWSVKNPTTYVWVEMWNVFATRWMMPLIFIISGASLFYALAKGSGFLQFIKDKALRLLVPVVVAAFSHAALQVYLERLTHGQFHGSFFEFLPHYFEGIYLDTGVGGNFAIHGMHLWYLLILFLFCLIFYPLFRWLKAGGRGLLTKLGDLLAFPGAMYVLLPLPLLLIKAVIDDTPLEFGAGGWGFIYYIWFLLAGFAIVSHERLQESIRRQRWLSLPAGLVLSAVFLFLMFDPGHGNLSPQALRLAYPLLSILSAWTFVLAILGFGMQHLTFSTPFLKYANEAVLPFYILHQTVLLSLGYFVVEWTIPDLLKWMVIFASSFATSMALYEFLVRRNNILRFLFGMKPAVKTSAVPAREAVLAR